MICELLLKKSGTKNLKGPKFEENFVEKLKMKIDIFIGNFKGIKRKLKKNQYLSTRIAF
jgi:hypothetical protein